MKLLPTHLTTAIAGFAATAAILVTLAGCAAPAETSGPTSASGGEGASVSDAAFQAARDAYDLELAQCLRDKGLDVKDPQPGQGIQESKIGRAHV